MKAWDYYQIVLNSVLMNTTDQYATQALEDQHLAVVQMYDESLDVAKVMLENLELTLSLIWYAGYPLIKPKPELLRGDSEGVPQLSGDGVEKLSPPNLQGSFPSSLDC